MASAAQITDNRVNAQPNTLKQGLTARHIVIREDEHEEFAELQSALIEELDPQGAMETVTFHDLLHAAWNLHRFRRIESELCGLGIGDFTDPSSAAALDRLTRYQARAQRAYYKALAELRKLQTNRALRREKLEDPADPEVPAITDINELTKLSRSEVTTMALEEAIKICDLEAGLLVRNARRQREHRN